MGVPRPSPHNIWMTPRPSPPKTWIKIGVPSPSPHEIWMTPRPSPPKTCRCPNPTATRYRGVGIRTPRSSRTKPGVKIGAPTPSPHEIVESGSRSPISTQNNGVPKPTPRARRCQDGVARPISTPAGVCGGCGDRGFLGWLGGQGRSSQRQGPQTRREDRCRKVSFPDSGCALLVFLGSSPVRSPVKQRNHRLLRKCQKQKCF